MAIVFNCPLCNHPYKLKDELAGKRATCKNPDCRKVITIPEPVGLTIAELGGMVPDGPRRAAPVLTSPADIEAAALKALDDSEQEREAEAAEKAIPVRCDYCSHQWTEPFEKAGKNTLCPNEECRQRVKVPMPKKGDAPQDWRTGGVNKPSLAKENFEKPADVIDAEARVVSKTAWTEGGGAEQELEPISLKRRLFVGTLIGAPILVLVAAIWLLVAWRKSEGEVHHFDKSLQEFAQGREELAPAEVPLFTSILEFAAGEYALYPRQQEPDKALPQALKHFTTARTELLTAAQKDERRTAAGERFAVAGELAMAILGLGGTDQQVKEGTRYRWVPEVGNGRPLRLNERTHTVHEELRFTMNVLQQGGADFDTKAILTRRLTRELARRGQPTLAMDIPAFLFTQPEQPEAKAIVALELYRADRESAEARKAADELKALLTAKGTRPNPPAASAQALWTAVGTEKAPQLFAAPSGQQIADTTRLAYVAIELLKPDPGQALALAQKPGGSLLGQLRALQLYAEWSTDPAAAIDSAISAVNLNAKGKKEAVPSAILTRLAQLAAASGRADQAKQLADLIPDAGLKAWAKGSAIQFAATPENKTKIDDAALEVPSDPKELRAGHAWGRLWQARQNTRVDGVSATTKAIASWPAGTLHPFGLAGIALGQHDR